MGEVLCRTSLAPLASLCFVLCFVGLEAEGLLDYQGRAGEHFHCMVEPSPGHIRCRTTTLVYGMLFPLFEKPSACPALRFAKLRGLLEQERASRLSLVMIVWVDQDRKKHINIKKYPENPPVRIPP